MLSASPADPNHSRRAEEATATAERVVAGSKTIEVARVRITEAGRKLLNEAHP
jgi:hypothetical protein